MGSVLLLPVGSHPQAQQSRDCNHGDRHNGHIVAGLRDGRGRPGLGRRSGAALGGVHALNVGIAGQLLYAFQVAAVVTLVAICRGSPVMVAAGGAGVVSALGTAVGAGVAAGVESVPPTAA